MASAHGKGLLTAVGSCKGAPKDAKSVMLIKQWHLSPTTITKGFKEKYLQEKNQSAIYIALADRIKSKRLDLVLAEGCEGEINEEFSGKFNGWDIESLKAEAQRRSFEKILTHVPMKLEAKFGDRIATWCGDNDKLIQEGLVRLSNMRGWAGFVSRLSETNIDAERRQLFAETAAELLKESKETPADELLPKIKAKLSEELAAFVKSLNDRNDSFVKILQEKEFKRAAVVIGGLHVMDLKDKLEAAGFDCALFEPSGYAREDEILIKDFEKAIK